VWFEADFADGYCGRVPNTVLRGYCPCAACQGHAGVIRFQSGHDSEIREIEEVGRYALCLTWGDLHKSGIYTFEYIRWLCELHDARGADLPAELPPLEEPR
jgi:DUF971 family protein